MIRRLRVTLIASCLLSAILSGCASVEQLLGADPRSVDSDNTDVFTPVSSCLALKLHVGEVQRINMVPLTLKARNTCGETIQVKLGGGPAHDFRVFRDGQLVWNYRSGTIVAIIWTKDVKPGEDLTFTAEWGLHTNENESVVRSLPSGQYTIQGRLTASMGQDEVFSFLETPAQRLVVR